MYKDWLHCIIFRLETIVSFFFMESLNCSTVIDQRNNNISILCCGLLFYQNLISVKNSGVYHTFPFYFQQKAL